MLSSADWLLWPTLLCQSEKWSKLQLPHSGRGVSVNGNLIVLEPYYAPLTECAYLRSGAICQMLRREVEVFFDRLARLTHNKTTKIGDAFEKRWADDMQWWETPLCHMRTNIFDGIEGALKAPPAGSFLLQTCAAQAKKKGKLNGCRMLDVPLSNVYTNCIGCNGHMHNRCGYPLNRATGGEGPHLCGECNPLSALSGEMMTNTPDAKKKRNDSNTDMSVITKKARLHYASPKKKSVKATAKKPQPSSNKTTKHVPKVKTKSKMVTQEENADNCNDATKLQASSKTMMARDEEVGYIKVLQSVPLEKGKKIVMTEVRHVPGTTIQMSPRKGKESRKRSKVRILGG
jgi:hypothetical protein